MIETGEESVTAFDSYSQHSNDDDMSGILEISTRVESQMNKLFSDLV